MRTTIVQDIEKYKKISMKKSLSLNSVRKTKSLLGAKDIHLSLSIDSFGTLFNVSFMDILTSNEFSLFSDSSLILLLLLSLFSFIFSLSHLFIFFKKLIERCSSIEIFSIKSLFLLKFSELLASRRILRLSLSLLVS